MAAGIQPYVPPTCRHEADYAIVQCILMVVGMVQTATRDQRLPVMVFITHTKN